MAFVIVNGSASAAVATNGTFTVNAPTATLAGAIKNRGGHTMVVHAMAAQFNFPNDFSISWSGAVATITYLGTTTIPAGSAIQVQFELDGDDINFPYHNLNGNQTDTLTKSFRGTFGQVFKVDFGAPLAAAATAVIATQALATTTLYSLTAAQIVTATLDVPRSVAVKSSTTDTTQTITVRGFDEYGVAISEAIALNGTTAVAGLKAFKQVVSLQSNITLAGTISVGTNAGGLGLPYYLPPQTGTGVGNVLKESQDGATPTAGTFIGGVQTKATATTGDVRGTVTPNVAPDGTKVYSVYMFVADPSFLGVPQFGT
jgi:hypothetical protein